MFHIKVYGLTEVGGGDSCVVAQRVKEDSHRKYSVLRMEAAGSSNFGREALDRRHRLESAVQDGLFEVAEQVC